MGSEGKEGRKITLEREELEDLIEKKVQERVEEELQKKKGSEEKKSQKEKEGMSRRSFLKKAGLGALGLGAMSLMPSAAYDIKSSDGLEVFESGTKYFDVNPGGPVEVKNTGFNLPSNGRINFGNGNAINENSPYFDLVSGGGGSDKVRIYDVANSQPIFAAQEGGLIEVLNADLEMGRNNIKNAVLDSPRIPVDSGDNANTLGNVNNAMLWADKEKGWSISASPSPTSGNLERLWRPNGSTVNWDLSSVSTPITITVSGVNDEYGWDEGMFSWMNNDGFHYLKVEGYDGSSWVQLDERTEQDGPQEMWFDLGYFYERYRFTIDNPEDSGDRIDLQYLAGFMQDASTHNLGAYLSRSGGKMYGNIDMNSNSIQNVDQINGQDASNLGGISPGVPQDVSGSRSEGTWYQNTTGNVLYVTVIDEGHPSRVRLHVNDSQTNNLADANSNEHDNTYHDDVSSASAFVPVDAYYKATTNGGVHKWIEQEL